MVGVTDNERSVWGEINLTVAIVVQNWKRLKLNQSTAIGYFRNGRGNVIWVFSFYIRMSDLKKKYFVCPTCLI